MFQVVLLINMFSGIHVADTFSKQLLLEQINVLREKNCKCGNIIFSKNKALKWNTKLEKAAFIHAKEIYKRDVLTHKGLNGSSAAIRIKQQNYQWQNYAENIALGYDNISEVMKAWIESPSHCKNLMGNYSEVGVAKVGEYWVMELATPK